MCDQLMLCLGNHLASFWEEIGGPLNWWMTSDVQMWSASFKVKKRNRAWCLETKYISSLKIPDQNENVALTIFDSHKICTGIYWEEKYICWSCWKESIRLLAVRSARDHAYDISVWYPPFQVHNFIVWYHNDIIYCYAWPTSGHYLKWYGII